MYNWIKVGIGVLLSLCMLATISVVVYRHFYKDTQSGISEADTQSVVTSVTEDITETESVIDSETEDITETESVTETETETETESQSETYKPPVVAPPKETEISSEEREEDPQGANNGGMSDAYEDDEEEEQPSESQKPTESEKDSESESESVSESESNTPSEVPSETESESESESEVHNGKGVAYGIDVSKWQGTIDWKTVSESGIDFAIIRVGYRKLKTGELYEDEFARYNLQEATKYGIDVGVYFYSTAITQEEVLEEVEFVLDIIKGYHITYPVVYDCEGYNTEGNRNYGLNKTIRTDQAITFLTRIQEEGYTPMFYASKNSLTNDRNWETSRLEKLFKIWVAQYPKTVDPYTDTTSYVGIYHMWQCSSTGSVPGIKGNVDLDVAYIDFTANQEPEEPTEPDTSTGTEDVTASEDTNVTEDVTASEDTSVTEDATASEDASVMEEVTGSEDISGTEEMTESGTSTGTEVTSEADASTKPEELNETYNIGGEKG